MYRFKIKKCVFRICDSIYFLTFLKMWKINKNTFNIRQILFVSSLRENIFREQLFVNSEIDLIIYYDKDINDFKFGKFEDINRKNIEVIYTLPWWYSRINETVDFSNMYMDIYIDFCSSSKDEIKQILSKDVKFSNDDFEKFYVELLKLKEKDYWDDWLIFYIFISDLSEKSKLFDNYFDIVRFKEYMRQKIESNELKDMEDIVLNFRYENIYQ